MSVVVSIWRRDIWADYRTIFWFKYRTPKCCPADLAQHGNTQEELVTEIRPCFVSIWRLDLGIQLFHWEKRVWFGDEGVEGLCKYDNFAPGWFKRRLDVIKKWTWRCVFKKISQPLYDQAVRLHFFLFFLGGGGGGGGDYPRAFLISTCSPSFVDFCTVIRCMFLFYGGWDFLRF